MDDELIPEITASDIGDTLVALAIFAGALVLAWVLAVVIPQLIHRLLRESGDSPLDDLVQSVRRPVFWLIVIVGLFLALRHPSYMEPHLELIDRLWIASIVVAVVAGLVRVSGQWFFWYQRRSEDGRGPGVMEPRILNILRRATTVTLLLIGGLVLLDVLGLEITPLIAGLGIGGLAVGLALQPVLSSLFASSSMMSDASIRVGDFIQIEDGLIGTVEHIGWRATRIRSFDNNIVLVPNSKLAESTFTNFSSTSYEADARLMFGVAYEADLQHVEDVMVDELTHLRDEFEGAVKSYEPIIRFQEFGDSNIDVMAKLRGIDFISSFMLRHMMVKRIHARLGQEGITINYPARRLFLQGDDVSGLDRLLREMDTSPNGPNSRITEPSEVDDTEAAERPE